MLSWQVYDVKGIRMGVNFGANKLRFPAPVPVDCRVRAGIELLERDGTDGSACVVDTVCVLVA